MAASLTSRYQKHRSRKVYMFENAINKIDILFFEDAEIKNPFQQVPLPTQLSFDVQHGPSEIPNTETGHC